MPQGSQIKYGLLCLSVRCSNLLPHNRHGRNGIELVLRNVNVGGNCLRKNQRSFRPTFCSVKSTANPVSDPFPLLICELAMGAVPARGYGRDKNGPALACPGDIDLAVRRCAALLVVKVKLWHTPSPPHPFRPRARPRIPAVALHSCRSETHQSCELGRGTPGFPRPAQSP